MNILIGALFLSIWHSILFWNQRIGISAILFALPVIYITTELNSANTIEELKRLKETEFKYTGNTSSYNEREKKKEQLDEYLAEKSIKLNEDTTLAEFNLSRILANSIEED